MEINEQQKKVLSQKGFSEEQVNEQLEKIKGGNPTIELVAPCTVGDGIVKLDHLSAKSFVEYFKNNYHRYSSTFFVPASGSGSRMFKEIYEYLDTEESSVAIQVLKERFTEFPFSEMLDEQLPEYYSEEHFKQMLQKMLDEEGLNFGAYPKALIPFHKYDQHIKTPIEEHVVMSLNIMQLDKVGLHFTVQRNHETLIAERLEKFKKTNQLDFDFRLSFQDPSTDALAFDEANALVFEEGDVVTRPAGHGALIQNLNEIDADVLFIRNIDNVQHEDRAELSVEVRQMLAGFLMRKVKAIHGILQRLQEDAIDLEELQSWLSNNLDLTLVDGGEKEKKEWVKQLLNRPIRVCGMVKNTGLPGGGPFWVRNQKGEVSRQIIEKAQVTNHSEQKRIFEKATHFNPVELVCWVKDREGRKFDLSQFIDQSQYFMVQKSQKGKKIKYIEKPGLWNGAMTDWLTFFVEIPVQVFSPVKTFTDLLHSLHQPLES